MLVIASIALSLVGIFVMRLWLLGGVVGVFALVLSVIEMMRGGSFTGGLLGSIAAVLLAASIFAVWLVTVSIGNESPSPRVEQTIELVVETEGGFSMSYTVPPPAGAKKATVTTIEATDTHSFSAKSQLSRIQFHAALLQSNLGDKDITCTVKVDGEILVSLTSDQRFVNCSTDLQ